MLPRLGPLPGRHYDRTPVPHKEVFPRYHAWLVENGYQRFDDFEYYVETFTRFMFIECECDRLPWSYKLPADDRLMLGYFNKFNASQPAPAKPKVAKVSKPRARRLELVLKAATK